MRPKKVRKRSPSSLDRSRAQERFIEFSADCATLLHPRGAFGFTNDGGFELAGSQGIDIGHQVLIVGVD